MADQMKGMLILNAIPNAEVEEKVATFLSQHADKISGHKLRDMLRKVPFVLSENASEKIGRTFVSRLEMLGASATYMPKTLHLEDSPGEDEVETNHLHNLSPTREDPHLEESPSKDYTSFHRTWKGKIADQLMEVNKELWLILSMIMIVGAMNYLLASQRMLLGLYTLPTLFSAYFYGRRHATFTAFASVLLVGIAIYYNPSWLAETKASTSIDGKWYEITAWGGILMVTAYAMGTLYDRDKKKVEELRQTYQGILVILRHFISNDQYTENHCYRVSIYSAKIAAYLRVGHERVEDIRSAALLHDIGKLEISRNLLYKAAKLTKREYNHMKRHVEKSGEILEPLEGPLGRIIPIILAHHEKFDGSGYNDLFGDKIPLEARVLTVADVYDSLTSDRPYRKAMAPFEAKDIITKSSGTEFDPNVVKAFLKAFSRGEMEIPNVVL